MTNTSLLRCAAAFLVLSAYIWLFGITGVIESDSAEYFADESREFSPPERGQADESDEDDVLSASDLGVNPVNDPKPGFTDLPVQGAFQSPSSGFGSQIDTVPFSAASQEDDTALEAPVVSPPPAVTTPEATTTPEFTTTPEVTTTPVTTTTPEPTITTTTPTTTPTPVTTTPENSNPETVVNPIMTERLTIMTSNGEVTDSALNIISKIVQTEIGSSFDVEAIKAQAIAAYTYVMHYQSQGGLARAELASVASERVIENVREVLGLALYYDGVYIPAVYCASSAGYTASSVNAWGGDLPYLRSVQASFDEEHDPNYGLKATFTSTDIRVAVLERTGINLTGDPSQWLSIIDRTDTVYVGSMSVGGRTSYTDASGREIQFTGMTFRNIMGTRALRSPAFEFTYDSASDKFTFTTYGYGHGVGMSQNGANILAREYGYDYRQILAFYYPGTSLR